MRRGAPFGSQPLAQGGDAPTSIQMEPGGFGPRDASTNEGPQNPGVASHVVPDDAPGWCVREAQVVKFLLWLVLFVLCWPVALLALVLYPIVWLFLLPFRLVGIAVDGVFSLLRAVLTLPARLLSARA